jgi:hypothetical protein
MPDVAVYPAPPEPGRLDGCNPPLQRLRASGTPSDMPQPGTRSGSHLQRMMVLFLIAAEIDRPVPPLGLLRAEELLEET